jgi:hypothetical protein
MLRFSEFTVYSGKRLSLPQKMILPHETRYQSTRSGSHQPHKTVGWLWAFPRRFAARTRARCSRRERMPVGPAVGATAPPADRQKSSSSLLAIQPPGKLEPSAARASPRLGELLQSALGSRLMNGALRYTAQLVKGGKKQPRSFKAEYGRRSSRSLGPARPETRLDRVKPPDAVAECDLV